MIKTTELRLGNYFFPSPLTRGIRMPQTGVPQVVTEIQPFLVQSVGASENPATIKKWNEFSIEDMSAIPLTQELLRNAGFVKLDDSIKGSWLYKFPVGHNVLYEHPDSKSEFIYGVTDYNKGYIHLTSVKYVHELQNLNFTISGKELKIEL